MKIYISIPISGLDLKEVRQKADMIKAKLSREGHTPVSPFDIYAGKNPTYEDYITSDLRALLDCDAIYLCEGWTMSCGCCIEHDAALNFHRFHRKNFKFIFETLSDTPQPLDAVTRQKKQINVQELAVGVATEIVKRLKEPEE